MGILPTHLNIASRIQEFGMECSIGGDPIESDVRTLLKRMFVEQVWEANQLT